jgi:hypothetical protein
VAGFIADEVARGMKPSTLGHRIAAITVAARRSELVALDVADIGEARPTVTAAANP